MTTTKGNMLEGKKSFPINKFLYGGFVLVSSYFLATKDVSSTLSNLGIALAFDPFDQKVMWNNKPTYQKIWLMVHLSVVFGLLGILFFRWI